MLLRIHIIIYIQLVYLLYILNLYIGTGATGRGAALDRIRDMYIGTDAKDPEEIGSALNALTNQFKARWVTPIFLETDNAEILKWYKKRFDRNIMSNKMKKKK